MTTLELNRTEITERRMPALAVVKQLDVFEHRAVGLGSRAPLAAVHQFQFEGGKEALGHRIVSAVAAAAHAAHDSVPLQHR